MTRFMAPRYFTQEQSDAVEQALRQLEIGDDEGIRVFIIALEYELAEYQNSQSSAEVPHVMAVAPVPELAILAQEITAVIERLEQMPDDSRRLLLDGLSAQDPFARQHDQAYLDAITQQMTSIASVCLDEKCAPPTASTLDDNEKHFISVVAEAYYECFELYPSENGGEPFATLLQRIVEISDLSIVVQRNELDPILSAIG